MLDCLLLITILHKSTKMTVEAVEKTTAEKKVKTINVRVLHLDETVHDFSLLHHASGADLYVQVIRKFNILESDYFDLEFMNEDGIRCWLDHTRPLVRQIVHGKDLVFRFCVKFYTPHPNLLEEEYTRYLFALQIKRDLVTGVLICSENTAALLGSYIVQAEIGDFIKEEYLDISYLRNLKILHEPNDDRLRRVMDFHKNHIVQKKPQYQGRLCIADVQAGWEGLLPQPRCLATQRTYKDRALRAREIQEKGLTNSQILANRTEELLKYLIVKLTPPRSFEEQNSVNFHYMVIISVLLISSLLERMRQNPDRFHKNVHVTGTVKRLLADAKSNHHKLPPPPTGAWQACLAASRTYSNISPLGMSPTDADFALLDTARKVEFYGVRLHPARDMEGLPMSLAVTHLGLSVFQNLTKINTFSWAKIRKLSFRRKRFLIKLHSMDYDVIEFLFDTRNDCKRFWKKCIEHHAFFRCPLQERSSQRRPKVVTKGSSFRYIGRTQKELIRFMRESNVRRPPFKRPSTARRAHPTMLTGPNYAHARMGTMSMTLRSKSADHRRHQLFDSSQLHLHGGIIGLSTGAVATSGYSTMGESSSGGHLAGEGLDADGKSLEESGGGGGGGRGKVIGQELMGTMVPPAGLVRTDFDGQPSPVATVPPAVLASTASITNTTMANSAPTAAPPQPPQKPTRMSVTGSTRRQNNEFVYGAHGGTLRRQASLAERRQGEVYGGDKAEEELILHSKQMSTSAIYAFGQQPQTSVQVLVKPTNGLLPSPVSTTTMTMNTVITTAQVRTPYVHDPTTGDVLFTTVSEKNLQPHTPYREEEILQAEENVEETQLPPSMKLLGTSCRCKTTATQTVPASDEEEEVGRGKMDDAEVVEVAEVAVGSNPDRPGRKKLRQHSNQSSSGRVDSIFDGGTDSSATAAQIVGIDQWSSSGTESTTGVIIRSGVTAEWTNEHEVKPNPESSIAQPQPEQVANYPIRTEKSENMNTLSNMLPTDTLPARTDQARASAQPFGFSYGFSRSIPAGVHLAGLTDPPDNSNFSKTPEIGFPTNWVRDRQDLPVSAEPFSYPKLTPFGFVPRQPVHSSHMLPPHTCNVQGGFYGEGVAPCLCVSGSTEIVLRDFTSTTIITQAIVTIIITEVITRGRSTGHRVKRPQPLVQPQMFVVMANRDIPMARTMRAPLLTNAPTGNEMQCLQEMLVWHNHTDLRGGASIDTKMQMRSASKAFEGGVSGDGGDEEEPPALSSHGHHNHRHLTPLGAPQPPTLPLKPGEAKEEAHVCKLHSQSIVTTAVATGGGSKRRQEEGRPSKSDDRKQPIAVGGHHHHHHHHHRVLREQEEQVEAPHRLKRRPVQSPALVGEEPQSWGISSPILGEERSRVGVTQASPVLSTVTSTAGKKIPVPKEYMEKIGSHKASIEALKRELRSVETASSVVTTASTAAAKSNIAPSRGGLGRSSAFSRGFIPESSGQHPPPSISPSDEAAARLADTSGSASLGDFRSAILAGGSGLGEDSLQKKTPTQIGKGSEGLLAAPQDATHLESESDSSPEQVGMHSIRRSLRESTSRHSAIPPPGMSSLGEAPKPPSLPRSSSFSSTSSSDSSIVSYSRSQSLFSHGAALSVDSSVSQPSTSSNMSSDEEPSFSSTSPSPEYYSHRRQPRHHHHTCHECISRSQGHLQSYVGSSHRIISRHHQRNRNYHQDQKSEGKRSKSSRSSRGVRPDPMLLKTFFDDEIALETIARQQKLLKRELAKQKQLAAALEEAKRRTQQLLQEEANVEKKVEEPAKIKEEQEGEVPRKGGKREFSSPAGSPHRGHHRSSSSGRRHHHHRKSRRHRRQPSYSEEERNSEEEHKKLLSDKHEEESGDRASHRKRSRSKSRHHRHRKMSPNGKDESQATSSKEKGNKEVTGVPEEQYESSKPQKQVAEQAHGESKKGESAHAEVDGKAKNFDQPGEGLPPPPPPPQSPPPPQQEVSSTINPSLQASSLSKASDSRAPTTEKQDCKPPTEEAGTVARDGSRQFCSLTITEEAGLARDIIKEVLKHTYAKVSSEASSLTHAPLSASSIVPPSQPNLANDPSTGKSTKRTKLLDGSFINPMETSHHHELTSTCLEPVPEGRVAETYSASRPYCPELTTFLGTNAKDQNHEGEEGEEEEDESDLDVEEIDSDSTSASEGSEDIEPFPLPPPDLIMMEETRQSPSITQLQCGRELHEVIEEIEGGAVFETSMLEHSAPLKPVTPIRLSQITVVEQPALVEYGDSSGVGDTEVGGEKEEEEEDINTEIADFVDMPWNLQEAVLRIIQSVLSTTSPRKHINSTLYSASACISARLREIEDKEWQVVVVLGSFTTTCIHKPGRLLSVFYKPYNILIWQSVLDEDYWFDFADRCRAIRVNPQNYALLPIGVLICISIILYAIAACVDLAQTYLHLRNDRVSRIVAYVALGMSAIASLFVMSAMLAFFNLYMGSWSIMLSVVGMTLGCSTTFQMGMRLLFDTLGRNTDTK
ncbi:FERM, RhoGEF and pleckstrin domain-containing protein [Echinococcus granulosus]|uniref:FERM, RhoGEF and pleckstrin domain-containing protein n=1 Tax=Echinococcus granulosus TaxID=6210 RepID=W6UKH3_ECHGR|nr:FERM, RhoGEF and pleckstrin domain-containing protein [Echinococcus granulosus]EUB61578.1 FERM, RhoGEF and pleckstrin domain-containing protein [Echinococcus granulosus]